jgi:hypothetical protein
MAQANYVTNAIRAFITDTSARGSTNPVRAAYVELVAALAGHPPRPVSIDADATDLEERADHLNKVLNALSAYLTAMLEDIAQNVPGGLDLRQVDALRSDLASDMSGTLQHSVERTAWRVA